MDAWAVLSLWTWPASVLVGCAVLLTGYLAAWHFRPGRQSVYFFGAVCLLLLALCSPLDALGDQYLFSAHMLQHLLLLLAVPPLLIKGITPTMVDALLRRHRLSSLEAWFRRPALAWFIGTLAVWLWHLPALYNAALQNETIHLLEHITFLITGVIFWWPVLAPLGSSRLRPLAAIPYLFLAAISSSLLGILLTFTPPGLYPAYLDPVDSYGILPFLRIAWGLSAAVDQQAAGLLMWIVGTPVYLLGAFSALARWYGAPEEKYDRF